MDVVHRWRGLGCALGLQATVTPPTTITSELGITAHMTVINSPSIILSVHSFLHIIL